MKFLVVWMFMILRVVRVKMNNEYLEPLNVTEVRRLSNIYYNTLCEDKLALAIKRKALLPSTKLLVGNETRNLQTRINIAENYGGILVVNSSEIKLVQDFPCILILESFELTREKQLILTTNSCKYKGFYNGSKVWLKTNITRTRISLWE